MDTNCSSIFFKAGQQQICSVIVHPVVIISVLDHFIRRNESEGQRVIGTLLGVYNSQEGSVEIRNCFPVPHTEGEQLAVDMDFHTNMLQLHQRVSPKEVIVGWYSTGDVDEISVIIHDFYSRKMTIPPVHVVVHPKIANLALNVKAYSSTSVVLNEKHLGSQFIPIPLQISTESDKIGVEVLMRTRDGKSPLGSDLENIESSMKKLDSTIDSLLTYVQKVVDGKIDADNNVGRFLLSTLSAIPKWDPTELERISNNNIQDLLLVSYLANLTRTQLQLSEKVQKIA